MCLLYKYNLKVIDLKNGRKEYYLYEDDVYKDFSKGKLIKPRKLFSDMNINEKSESLRGRERYRKNKIAYIRRIVDMNYSRNTSFLTLTFKDEVDDLTYANNELSKFFKRLTYYVQNNIDKNFKLKYLWVWEVQYDRFEKCGKEVIHYHLLLFDFPFVNINLITDKIWGLGFCKINSLSHLDDARNVGVYFTAYMGKQWGKLLDDEISVIEKNNKIRAWNKSANLILPKEKESHLGKNDFQKLYEDLKLQSVFTNDYINPETGSKVTYFVVDDN